MSQRGWIRAMKGHADPSVKDQFKFKEGDGPAFAFHAQTTDKLLLVSTNGRFYTLGADKLPGGRGFGEPVRLMVDVENDSEILALLPARTGGKLLLTADDGRGFVANIDEITAETRKGRSEEHTSELQSLMRISYAVFCLKKKNNKHLDEDTHMNTDNTP